MFDCFSPMHMTRPLSRALLKVTLKQKGAYVLLFLTGAEQGLELYQVLHLLADMASHRDTAEGGANEEFNDIIKWRSGMF